jgi:hypothetical protein
MVIITNKELLTYGLQFAGHPAWINETPNKLTKLNREHFRSAYGIGPDSLLNVINDLQSPEVLGNQRIKNVNIQELFTALSWLKQYPIEHNHAGRWKSTENTARSKSWKYVLAIQKLIDRKVNGLYLIQIILLNKHFSSPSMEHIVKSWSLKMILTKIG